MNKMKMESIIQAMTIPYTRDDLIRVTQSGYAHHESVSYLANVCRKGHISCRMGLAYLVRTRKNRRHGYKHVTRLRGSELYASNSLLLLLKGPIFKGGWLPMWKNIVGLFRKLTFPYFRGG